MKSKMVEDEGAASGSEVSGPIRQVILISAGASHSVALLSGNIVCSWGRGEDGQLGHGDAEDRPTPTQLSTLDGLDIISITCGADHTTSYSESRMEVYSWGWGDFGRLGHGNSSDLFTPQPIKALHSLKIRQIACGDSHCLAVTMDGEVQSWGRNQNGQLGLGTTEDSLVPQKIQAFQGDKMIMVACGWRHTISVSSSGGLYTYGWSKYGQLGHGDFEDHLTPHKVEALRDSYISMISGGWRHTMALTSDGNLYGWGWNKFGQVGVGDNIDHCSPVQVKFPHEQKVVQISCGWRHTLAITERQNVFSWGRGTNGQLGHGESMDRNLPKIIEVLSADGSGGHQIEASTVDPSLGKSWVSPSDRYAIVPDESGQAVSVGGNGNDASVPESDVKRIRI
ncbi:ultraviolet-B receptor UVR8 isoform X3 [Populus trichocarpa]|uniref:ultraviolet-B receptor UVR8 isoform X3 n=1 Tax=Populus trichocarpa TaxID=3694 RepID=UPI000D188DC6|nr:ultraviolet-B receptor UVR8 isoform X3 [Populus trichocarpa]|eukprot:XP_024461400.1 ultraviolet-B receptor UVR8 isoform X4 [Populus trichocarpa]